MQRSELVLFVIAGTQQYSKYTGYAQTYQWAGIHHDTTPRYNNFYCYLNFNHWNCQESSKLFVIPVKWQNKESWILFLSHASVM